jgi:predicted alpha/beta hydrolase family esterase
MNATRTLILPGLGGSGPQHWQSLWERRFGYARVDQRDWDAPEREEWVRSLDAAVCSSDGPVVLVAHSLACALVAHWAAATGGRTARAALLVAPADIDGLAGSLPPVASFAPVPAQPLPFASIVVASEDDPYVRIERARAFAAQWKSEFVSIGARGHINAASGLDDWPQGHAMLASLTDAAAPPRAR